MINISSYIFYNLSNLLFALLIPESFAKLFFLNYSLASGVFTFVIFFHFSKKNIFSEKILMILITVVIILSELLSSKIFIIWLSTFLIIYSDYFFSQRKNYFLNFFFKFLLMTSSLLLYKEFLNPIYVLKVKIIIIFITFISYYFFLRKHDFSPLKLNSPLVYNFWTCLIYFSSLFILTLIVPSIFLKIVYISFQILIGIQLKIFDIEIRRIEIKFFNLENIFLILSLIYLLFLSLFTNIYYLLILYLIIFLSLNLLKKKYIN